MGTAGLRVRQLVDRIAPGTKKARLDDLRTVRHVLAHDADRIVPDLLAAATGVYAAKHDDLTYSGAMDARELASRAIRDFIGRHAPAVAVGGGREVDDGDPG